MDLVRERRKGPLLLQLHSIEPDDSALSLLEARGGSKRMIGYMKRLDVFEQSDHVVIALWDGILVGAFGILGSAYHRGGWSTRGTYVLPSYRREGIASTMWSFAASALKPSYIDCVVISDAGFRFANHWKKTKRRGVKMDVCDDRR